MTEFSPIAIVGRACLLPGADTPDALWRAVREGRDLLGPPPAGDWRLDPEDVRAKGPDDWRDKTWSDVGGHVRDFVFDPSGFAVDAGELEGLGALFQWALHTAREALRDAGVEGDARTGAVLGNLSYPSPGLSHFAERVWLGQLADAAGVGPVDPRNRFMSGLPAHMVARALGLGGAAYALDAACASSLYAIELACRDLAEGRADRMLAGAVNRADDLFLHVGFCALSAMSRSGQSRPFHAKADGLVPGEGAGFVVLERLEDAIANGRTIHGVIRGVGLSNDGRGKSLLAPSAEGQARSMRAALEMSGLTPDDVPYIECHATGTRVGDAAELESMASAYGTGERVIGSLKGNIGHLITAAGVAGLIKLLEAFRHRELPPTPHLDAASDDLDRSPFRALGQPEPWTGPLRAGLSAFGFGGNDAHLLVEAFDPAQPAARPTPASVTADPIVAVALGARVGNGECRADFEQAVVGGARLERRASAVELPLRGLRFPPNDLRRSHAQQTSLLAAALEAVDGVELPAERTGIYIGYGCDPEIARWGARWRTPAFARALGADGAWASEARDAFVEVLEAAHVVGCMPNMPANRLSSQLDTHGPAFTLSGEELSGVRALEVGVRALRREQIDVALVGAVDFSDEEVHRAAAQALLPERSEPADAAIALLLMRESEARRRGLTPLAAIAVDDAAGEDGRGPALRSEIARRFGHAHAASGLIDVAAAVLSAAHGRDLDGQCFDERRYALELAAMLGQRARVQVSASASPPSPAPRRTLPAPTLRMEAHPPAVRVPSPRQMVATPAPRDERKPEGVQHMAPAPWLPPTLPGAAPRRPRPATTAHSKPATTTHAPGLALDPGVSFQAGAPMQEAPLPRLRASEPHTAAPLTAAPLTAAPSAPSATGEAMPQTTGDPALDHFIALQQRLGEIHRDFITQQTELHQRFLALTQAPLTNANAQPSSATAQRALGQPGFTPVGHGQTPTEAPRIVRAAPATEPMREMTTDAPAAPVARTSAAPEPGKPAPSRPESAVTRPAPARPPVSAERPTHAPEVVDEAELPLAFRPRGPSFDKAQLAIHAAGKISEIYGPLFEQQDDYAVQVRMPSGALLLADRMTGLDAEPGSMAKGTCWTETDVRADSWWLNDGYMPAGIHIESGQADLMLISYLGVDFANRGERAYRLLGCDLTWLGPLPTVGETLVYDIHVDGHAKHGDVRLFFFHYDCWVKRPDGSFRPALRVRSGQAGFFTPQELAESAGILWKPEEQELAADPRLDAPALPMERTRFDREALESFAGGDLVRCFGDAFYYAQSHTRTPHIQGGRMLFLDEVTELDLAGGPWGRGYLRAVQKISPDDWFFDGHFENDPCMPGTLMFEGCVQAMAFYLASLGYTVDKDGWRFEPVQDETFPLRCRGQVIPSSEELVYELFVEEIHDGPEPTLYADLLCTVDGLGAFHARRLGLKLVPDWPLDAQLAKLPRLSAKLEQEESRHGECAVERYQGGEPFTFDHRSLLACAWGRPSEAFGPMYERFDSTRRTARLPGPPYHFMTRVLKTGSELGVMTQGERFVFEYDVPQDAWYFEENGCRVMPFAVLLEAALQPCGWVASYLGSALTVDGDLLFRNLDGKGTIKAEVAPGDVLRTTVRVKNISQSAGMIIEGFEVHCTVGETEVYELDTVFGFFPPSAFDDQPGLGASDEELALFERGGDFLVDLTTQPTKYCGGAARLAAPMLLMIDRVEHFDPEGGRLGLGSLRAEKDVDPNEWFFKAHFFQDPVQPGSLGIEAMLQAMQFAMIELGLAEGDDARFEAIASDLEHVWKYRGQVVPKNGRITTTLEIVERGEDERGAYILADCHLWVDGKRIYETKKLGMRVVRTPAPGPERGARDRQTRAPSQPRSGGACGDEERLDPDGADAWLRDHCPTYTLPALPLMSLVDRMMGAARAELGDVAGLHDVEVHRWVVVDEPTRLKTEVVRHDDGEHEVRVLVWRDAANAQLSRFELAASAKVGAPDSFDAIEPAETTPVALPYESGQLFHGPAFRLLKSLEHGRGASRGVIDAGAGDVPHGTLNQALLDAATHVLPHDRLHEWSERIGDDMVGYPRKLDVRFHGEAPKAGEVQAEARFLGFEDDDTRFPVFRLQLTQNGQPFADMRLVEILMPKGPLGVAAPEDRRRFLHDGAFVAGLGLSHADGDATRLERADVTASDWLPGTVRRVYAAEGADLCRDVAVKEHLARKHELHPRQIEVRDDDELRALPATRPVTAQRVSVMDTAGRLVVQDEGTPALDLSHVRDYWREHFGMAPLPVEDLYYGFIERFVADVALSDPQALEAIRGQGVLYLANHQVGIESLEFSMLAAALGGLPTLTLAKKEHAQSWLGRLIELSFRYPGITDPGVITYFDRSDPASLPGILNGLGDGAQKSLLVHVEGTRSLSCAQPVKTMSSVFCDLAIRTETPIVPVRFVGGLPVEPAAERLEYPLGMGKQTIHIGAPIAPEQLAALPYKERTERVVAAINALGPAATDERPAPGDADFDAKVRARIQASGQGVGLATAIELLKELAAPSDATQRLLAAADGAPLDAGSGPEAEWLRELARLVLG